jgi:hypothetical protein
MFLVDPVPSFNAIFEGSGGGLMMLQYFSWFFAVEKGPDQCGQFTAA